MFRSKNKPHRIICGSDESFQRVLLFGPARFYQLLQDDIHSEERRMIHRQVRLLNVEPFQPQPLREEALAGMVWTKQLLGMTLGQVLAIS